MSQFDQHNIFNMIFERNKTQVCESFPPGRLEPTHLAKHYTPLKTAMMHSTLDHSATLQPLKPISYTPCGRFKNFVLLYR